MAAFKPHAIAVVLLVSVASLVVARPPAAAVEPIEPVRFSTTIEGERTVIELRDLTRGAAQEAIRSAFLVMGDTLRALDVDNPQSDLAALNGAAGKGPVQIGPETLAVLRKALGFCQWSRGAHGPLGHELYDLWERSSLPPAGEALATPIRAATCETLQLFPETLQASLASGSRLDLRHFIAGVAVDRATDHLRNSGGRNLWVQFGPIVRAHGTGADGRGWVYSLPQFAGMSEGLEPIRLNDMAIAAVSAHRNRLRFGDVDYAPFLDQRDGQPASGVIAVLVATPLAADAEALATTMVILGNREGSLRLANVEPAPAALWLLGDGTGEPLLNTYKWSTLGSL